ncbi:MAG: DMT family transporter [Granulosicoccus sp.]|nr:DMT family transporter [Granulosicoccus sp.]
MNGVLWGLCGAILIGASDCIARVTARQVSSSLLFLFIMGLSLAVLTLWDITTGEWPPWHLWAWTASAMSGVLNLVALYFLYQALARGPVAVASPAASSFTVLLVLLNIVAGEPWSLLQIGAMALVFLGIVMLTRPTAADNGSTHVDAKWLRITVFYALAAAFAVSFRMFLAQEAGEIVGAFHALYLNRLFALTGSVLLVAYLILRNHSLSWPTGSLRGLVLLQAIFETGALAAFLIGSSSGGRISASIGFAAFAAATALFARIWLKELIGWHRAWWIFIVGVGVLLAVAGSPTA